MRCYDDKMMRCYDTVKNAPCSEQLTVPPGNKRTLIPPLFGPPIEDVDPVEYDVEWHFDEKNAGHEEFRHHRSKIGHASLCWA